MSHTMLADRADGTLGSHVLTDGSSLFARIESVATFSGCAFEVGSGFIPLLIFGAAKKSWMPARRYDFGPDTPTIDVAGWCQGAVAEIGRGRLAFYGEAAMFTAQLFGPDHFPVGMNCPVARDNARFLLNIVHWLSRVEGMPPAQTYEPRAESDRPDGERQTWWRAAHVGLCFDWRVPKSSRP